MSVSSDKLGLQGKHEKPTLGNTVQATRASQTPASASPSADESLRREFRKRFQRAWRKAQRTSGGSERFEAVFTDILHRVPVASKQAGELYLELTAWVRNLSPSNG